MEDINEAQEEMIDKKEGFLEVDFNQRIYIMLMLPNLLMFGEFPGGGHSQ